MPCGPGGSGSAFTSQSLSRGTRYTQQQAGPAVPYDDNPHGALHLSGPSAIAAGATAHTMLHPPCWNAPLPPCLDSKDNGCLPQT